MHGTNLQRKPNLQWRTNLLRRTNPQRRNSLQWKTNLLWKPNLQCGDLSEQQPAVHGARQRPRRRCVHRRWFTVRRMIWSVGLERITCTSPVLSCSPPPSDNPLTSTSPSRSPRTVVCFLWACPSGTSGIGDTCSARIGTAPSRRPSPAAASAAEAG